MPLPATDSMDHSSRLLRRPGAEPIPGYRLLQPLGKGGFGEVWKCEAPGGLLKAIKFIQAAEEERPAIERIKDIRHPFLLSLERIERVGPELLLVLELADRHLADVLQEARRAGQAGIDRARLLGYLAEAAEAIDLLNQQYDLQHLDVKPHNLFLIGNHVKVADFGQVGRAGSRGGVFSPIYAAPERFENTASRHSDQYSLAIVYQELLTGALPFNGTNGRQLLMQHLRGEPDLSALPAGDCAAVARALAKRPADRFPSCADFVRALASGRRESESRSQRAEVGEQKPAEKQPQPGSSSLASEIGLQLLERVRCTPLTEVRKARSSDRGDKLVTFLFAADADDKVIDRWSQLTHPALVPARLALVRGGLALIADARGRSLRDRFRECSAAGQPGIPRKELLGYLRAAASALDFLYERHGVAHLGLNPRNLLVNENQLQIAEFGLAHLLWLPSRQDVAGLNSRYSAPELSGREAGPACDQYSLALIYRDLLTGFESGLDRLAPADRTAVARALNRDPAKRWRNCTELIENLKAIPEVPAQRRSEERTAWPYPLRVCSVGAEGKAGVETECLGKDISSRGIGFYLTGQPPTTMIQLRLPSTPQTTESVVAARVVRIQGQAGNQFEIGAILLSSKVGA
jgi:serine/threonine protein kinase